jgi:hypothetical protein
MLIPPYGADLSESRLSSQVGASSPVVGDQLGQSVGLSDPGRTVAVGAWGQSSSAPAIRAPVRCYS